MSVMCPIPTCKRYSPNISTSPHVDQIITDIEIPSPISIDTPSLRGRSGSAVIHYPHTPNPPQYTESPVISDTPGVALNTGSPLLDVCVDKVLHVVLHEIGQFDIPQLQPTYRQTGLDLDLEGTDDESDTASINSRSHQHDSGRLSTDLSLDLSHLGPPDIKAQPPSPLVRRSSKRRRNNVITPPVPGSGSGTGSNVSEGGWPFLKELGRVVECDVCALLLYEPVTTPCQHVSGRTHFLPYLVPVKRIFSSQTPDVFFIMMIHAYTVR
jgi:hypothetical protein